MQQVHIRITKEQHEKMKAIQERDGIPMAEQSRRAIREWLEKRDRERPEREILTYDEPEDEYDLDGFGMYDPSR